MPVSVSADDDFNRTLSLRQSRSRSHSSASEPNIGSSPYAESSGSAATIRRLIQASQECNATKSTATAVHSDPPSSPSLQRPNVLEREMSGSDVSIRKPQEDSKKQATRPKKSLARLASQSARRGYFSTDDHESEVDADVEAVKAELERDWCRRKYHPSKGVSDHKRRDTTRNYEYRHREATDESDTDEDARLDLNVGDRRAEESDSRSQSSDQSFTLKDRQEAINITHPFGLRLWKPAIYKKFRSVQRTAEADIHSAPGSRIGEHHFTLGNLFYTLVFGWWLSVSSLVLSVIVCMFYCVSSSAVAYSRVFLGLAHYLFFPFGKFVELRQEEEYAEEDAGEGLSIVEYQNYGSNDVERGANASARPRSVIGNPRSSIDSHSETESLIGRYRNQQFRKSQVRKHRLFGRGEWNLGRIVFFLLFYGVMTPLLLLVSAINWLFIFTIPISRVMFTLFSHIRRHPLAITFHSDISASRAYNRSYGETTTVLLCMYRAVRWKYYKFTVDGTNIFFINLMFLVMFVIIDAFMLGPAIGHESIIAHPALIFLLALISIIPLAYFIGMAVASISAQSSIGMGAAINAFFGSVVEVFLYLVALTQGKGRLVEGSIIGSVLAGILLMPGLSMCAGAFKRKTQRFNAKSAGVTSTMLLFAILGAFAPTIFYQIYGTYELRCAKCFSHRQEDCQRCYLDQTSAVSDPFYQTSVKPFSYICSAFLLFSYLIGLWFTLRTHAAQIWQTNMPPPVEHFDSRVDRFRSYTNPPPQSPTIRQSVFLNQFNPSTSRPPSRAGWPDEERRSEVTRNLSVPTIAPGLSSEENLALAHNVARVAAEAATLAVRDHHSRPRPYFDRKKTARGTEVELGEEHEETEQHNGHDAPNWGRTKSAVILLGATVLYAVIAEILIDTVDVVLENINIDEKFLGFTLFALVPNTTEFLNAISFALNGNIALRHRFWRSLLTDSMEIGSAYALQVCLLQIPALVAFSAYMHRNNLELAAYTFSLIFPRWDLITVVICVFLLSYMYGEGKSNYFKGSILVMSYFVVLLGFYYSPTEVGHSVSLVSGVLARFP